MSNLLRVDAMQIDCRNHGRSVILCALFVTHGIAYANADNDATRVTPQQQQARDNDRLRILTDELTRVKSTLEDLAKRRAERIAAADSKGVEETDTQRDRVLADKAGLEREIAAASKASPSAVAAPSGASPSTTARRTTASSPLPWWDVYSKAPMPSSESKSTSTTP